MDLTFKAHGYQCIAPDPLSERVNFNVGQRSKNLGSSRYELCRGNTLDYRIRLSQGCHFSEVRVQEVFRCR